jgi:DNA-binding Xre family transcriptional regulator
MEEAVDYVVKQGEGLMSDKIRIMVPDLLKERNLTPGDLMYGTRLAPGTAYTLADAEKTKKMTAISFDVLQKLCKFFDVGPGDILKLVDDTSEAQQEGD